MPGIGQLSGKSFVRTPYLFWALAGINFWSTVPALAAMGLSSDLLSGWLSGRRIIGLAQPLTPDRRDEFSLRGELVGGT
jgi:hypothetical protein